MAESESPEKPTRPQQLLVRSSFGTTKPERTSTCRFITGALDEATLKAAEGNTTLEAADECMCKYSSDGRLVSVITDTAVNVYSSEDEKLVQSIELSHIDEADFSPLGTFLVTFDRRARKGIPNLLVHRVEDGAVVLELYLKEKNSETWPTVRWSEDEALMCHLVTNQINFHEGRDPTKQIGKLHLKGLYCYALSRNGRSVACFVPEKKGQPASASLYELAHTAEGLTVSPTPTAAKTFFRASSAKFDWSPNGSGVLVTATSDVDASNESYYGESQLHLLYADGQCLTVPFNGNKGPIHDAKWSPQGKDFVVIQGYQPAKCTLFNAANCTPVRDFGHCSRNTILFSPHGRFLCLGGFGNLAGEMDFWEKNKFKMLGTCQDMNGPTTFEWTPDGRSLVTAALFPRRRVDEGFKVWTYYGELVYSQKIDKLTQVAIRPALEGVYPNRPMSPRLSDKDFQRQMAQKMEASQPKAYVPPHLRGKQGATTSSIVKDSKPMSGPRKLIHAAAAVDPEVKAAQDAAKAEKKAAANKARRERKKQNKETQEEKEERIKKEEKEERMKKEQEEAVARLSSMSDKEVVEKKIKKLSKKEAQASKLVERQEAGEAMDEAQLSKIAGLADLRKELEELRAQLAAM